MAPVKRVWWFANPPYAEQSQVERMEGEALGGRLLDLFREDAGPDALDSADADLALRPNRCHRRCAHTRTPSSGQAASLAIEDAVMLAKCLRDIPGAPAALERFESERRPRVDRIVSGQHA